MSNELYPMTFTPVLKDYIWGGRNLEKLFGRDLPPGKIAESWEIAAHPDGTAVVNNGRFAGTPLTQVHQTLGLDLIGTHNRWAEERGKFPLLIKLLDANQKLSVQVHPDDEYAKAHEGNELGKTEMWVILHAEPEAAVTLGVTEGTTPEKLRQAIDAGGVSPLLHHIAVQTGDVVCVPSGSLHAILDGAVIAEIQQSSNITYRVYDWDRLRNGKPRELHVDKALDVINFQQVEPGLNEPQLVATDENGVQRYELCANDYFVTERVHIPAGQQYQGMCDGRTLEVWGVIEGHVQVNEVGLTAVQFCLLPAAMGKFTVVANSRSTLLRTYVNER